MSNTDKIFQQGFGADDPTITRILDAAMEQYALVGIRRASMDDIAARADVSRMTIYRRIGKNEMLVQAALLREGQRIIARIDNKLVDIPTVQRRIVELFSIAFHDASKHPLWQQLIKSDPEDILPYLTIGATPYVEIASRYIQSAIEGASNATVVEPELLAQYIIRLFHSFFLTPDRDLDDKDESFVREYFEDYLGPLLAVVVKDSDTEGE